MYSNYSMYKYSYSRNNKNGRQYSVPEVRKQSKRSAGTCRRKSIHSGSHRNHNRRSFLFLMKLFYRIFIKTSIVYFLKKSACDPCKFVIFRQQQKERLRRTSNQRILEWPSYMNVRHHCRQRHQEYTTMSLFSLCGNL